MEQFKLTINRKIDKWDEAIPLGNGEMGCLVFGSSEKLVLALDRGDIWDRSDSPERTQNGFTYSNFVSLAKKGDLKTIHKIFDVPYAHPTPTKLPTGRIEIKLGTESKDNSFILDMQTAQCSYSSNGISLHTYVHATSGMGLIKTNVRNPDFEIVNPKFGKKTKFDNILKKFTFKDAISNKLKNVKYPEPRFENVCKNGIKCRCFIQELNDGDYYGIATAQKNTVEGCEIAYYAYYSKALISLKKALLDKVTHGVNEGFDKLFVTHKEWWENYNGKSSISVPDDYIINRYNMGNYLLGSASRKGCYPMPLQGLWTACDDKYLPPWKGDYHHDLNTQMTYYSYLKANRLEQGESFLDYLSSLTGRAEEFAKKYFGAEGHCLPSVMDIDGYAMGGWPLYSLSPTNQMWLCQAFERYYTYTGNKEFLQKTAYPYMKQSAKFILSILEEDNDGYYVLPVSSSPEIHDNSKKAYLTANSNYDQAMMIYIFSALKKLAKEISEKIDAELWSNSLKKLRPLAVNNKNILRISPSEDLKESHRHQSHAMSIHPLRLLDYSKEEDAKIIDATIDNAVELGSKWYTGYSMTWLAEFFTVAKDGDSALKYLELFWKYFCSINTFHLNGDYTKQGYSSFDYRPFTLEGNFCALDVLQEMMLFSENGFIELFPAIPKKWKNASFKTLRGWGGVLVSAETVNSELANAEFLAENDVTFILRNSTENMVLIGGVTEATPKGLKITLLKNEKMKIQTKNS